MQKWAKRGVIKQVAAAEFLPLRFHHSVRKVLKNLGQNNDF
ncbi:hypothetical protein GCM10010294_70820 [Streptomyces griseoloalbus]|nr:hypothetical protein GCM10010294_70820 [Streptomyces griseoloalbus]